MYIEIEETKWALIIILEKILDIDAFGYTGIGREKELGKSGATGITDCINLNGVTYIINGNMFGRIMVNLQSKGAIKITQLDSKNVVDFVLDEDEYVIFRSKEKPNLSAKEIKNEKTMICGFKIKDIEKIKQEIKKLNSRKVSLESLKNYPIKVGKKEIGDEKIELGISEDICPENYIISIKDREIWVNDSYIISRPHATGSNFEFVEYFIEHPNVLIERSDLPENLRKKIVRKRFLDIIYAIGFKGEILKLFFSKRSKNNACFENKISRESLQERGVNKQLLTEQLQEAHNKNSKK